MSPFPMPDYPDEAKDLQRRYAAHVYLLRGSLKGATRAGEPSANAFDLKIAYAKVGDIIEVNGTFPSAPLLAYVDRIPMVLRPSYGTGGVSLALEVPEGTRGGPVRLIWPTKTLVAKQPLWIASRDLVSKQYEAPPGGELLIGLFHERPVEVHVGWKEVPASDIEYDNFVLKVRVPADAVPGPIMVVTHDNVYIAQSEYRPGKRKTT